MGCFKNTHKIFSCPLIHYVANKDFIIKRHLVSKFQEREPFYIRRYKKFNCLQNIKKVKELTAEFRPNQEDISMSKMLILNEKLKNSYHDKNFDFEERSERDKNENTEEIFDNSEVRNRESSKTQKSSKIFEFPKRSSIFIGIQEKEAFSQNPDYFVQNFDQKFEPNDERFNSRSNNNSLPSSPRNSSTIKYLLQSKKQKSPRKFS